LIYDFKEEEVEDSSGVSINRECEVNDIEYMKAKLETFEKLKVKAIHKLYDEAYLRRLIWVVEIFISADQT
jgi:hypothetical protein